MSVICNDATTQRSFALQAYQMVRTHISKSNHDVAQLSDGCVAPNAVLRPMSILARILHLWGQFVHSKQAITKMTLREKDG